MNLMTGRNLDWQDYPKLWITREVATRLLVGTGETLADLYREAESLDRSETRELSSDFSASILVQDTVYSETAAQHVIGYWPGTMGGEALGRQGLSLDNHMIVVMAKYDAPPPSPDGTLNPGANDNASGVAVMLEAIRVLQETGYQPYKTLMFVAYSAEGLEGGELVHEPDVKRFLTARRSLSNLELEAVVQLRAVGGGTGERLEIAAGGSQRLAQLFGSAARRLGVRTTRARTSP